MLVIQPPLLVIFLFSHLFQCAVIVATVRALKMHGGGPDVVAGKPLDFVYKEEAVHLVEVSSGKYMHWDEDLIFTYSYMFWQAGCANLVHHIKNIQKFGVSAVVAINRFATDTDAELELVRTLSLAAGATAAVVANHWAEGGAGAADLGRAVIDACAAARAAETTGFR